MREGGLEVDGGGVLFLLLHLDVDFDDVAVEAVGLEALRVALDGQHLVLVVEVHLFAVDVLVARHVFHEVGDLLKL